MTICLVTDRRRLLAAGATEHAAMRCVLSQARYAVEAGVDLIQVRERDLEARSVASLVREVLAVARGTRTRVVVNERVDVALACGADGVHLRGDSMSAVSVRNIAPPGFIIGRSVHGVAEAAAAGGADYLIAGTVFPSASKPEGHEIVGVDGLRAIAAASRAPILAIGGVTLDRIAEVAAAGASGVAAIGLFTFDDRAPTGGCRAGALKDVVAHARSQFDRVISPP